MFNLIIFIPWALILMFDILLFEFLWLGDHIVYQNNIIYLHCTMYINIHIFSIPPMQCNDVCVLKID